MRSFPPIARTYQYISRIDIQADYFEKFQQGCGAFEIYSFRHFCLKAIESLQ